MPVLHNQTTLGLDNHLLSLLPLSGFEYRDPSTLFFVPCPSGNMFSLDLPANPRLRKMLVTVLMTAVPVDQSHKPFQCYQPWGSGIDPNQYQPYFFY